MKIMIATPAGGGLVTAPYAASLVGICKLLSQRGIESSYHSVTFADIEMARNYLASEFVADQTATHLLFVDADMSFRASLIARMLELHKKFTSAIYVKRNLDLGLLFDSIRPEELKDPVRRQKAISRIMQFVGRRPVREAQGTISVQAGFAKFEGTGMGICLLAKEVFQEMIAKELVEKHPGAPTADPKITVYGFFDRSKDNQDVLAEDLSFCRRWVQGCQGEIWACIDEPIRHIGTFEYSGVYLDKITASPA
jgi:hypothetical protein